MKKTITLNNVSFGVLLFLPQGLIVIALTLIAESLIMTGILAKKYFDINKYLVTCGSNLLSGAIGFLASVKLYGGWWLVAWYPWVSSHEVNKNNLFAFIIYFTAAILLTFMVEILFNLLFLKKRYGLKRVLKASILANVLTNIPIIFLMYLYSFGVI